MAAAVQHESSGLGGTVREGEVCVSVRAGVTDALINRGGPRSYAVRWGLHRAKSALQLAIARLLWRMAELLERAGCRFFVRSLQTRRPWRLSRFREKALLFKRGEKA